MRRSLAAERSGALVISALVLAACSGAPLTTTPPSTATTAGSDVTAPDTPSRSSPGISPSAGACAPRPTSPGPAASLVVVSLTAPATATAGSSLTVSAQLVVISSGPRIVLTPRGSSVEILRGATVVGRATGPAGADVPLPLTAGASYPGQTLPTQVPLVACDGAPLPPGSYGLRAVVAYGGDPLNGAPGGSGGGSFVIVSDPPLDLTVT